MNMTTPKPNKALLILAAMTVWANTTMAQALGPGAGSALSWGEALGGNDISNWMRGVILGIMAIFIMVSIILGSLAFKQLAADGNWKEFWSKIAGAVGMFVVPIAVNYLLAK
jgi:hypothetical protein